MPDTPASPPALDQAQIRAGNARHIVTGLAAAHPALAALWRQINDALADIPPLTAEITSLRGQLAAARLGRANLAAAGRATLNAWRTAEPDPLSYLQDELAAQGFDGRPI